MAKPIVRSKRASGRATSTETTPGPTAQRRTQAAHEAMREIADREGREARGQRISNLSEQLCDVRALLSVIATSLDPQGDADVLRLLELGLERTDAVVAELVEIQCEVENQDAGVAHG